MEEDFDLDAESENSDISKEDSRHDSEEDEDYDSEEFRGFGDYDDDDDETIGAEVVPDEGASEHPNITKAAGAYVPPHLRAKQVVLEGNKETDEQTKLKRQAQGLLNRLSEQNIGSILTEIEGLYRNFSRNDTTTIVTRLVLDTVSSRSNLLDSFVILHAALVASLTKIVGIEFAASFIYDLVTSYKKHYSILQAAMESHSVDEERGKECTNLIVLLSELYNFQVISSILLYDVIRDLLDGDLAEFNVELLLKLLKNSGTQLRHDDPNALNDIVAIVQQKTSNPNSGALGSRAKFMLETLSHLKNNKSKAVQNQAVATEATTRMKKFLGGLGKSHTIRSHETLRVSLADLLSSDQKGKWWLVGAAWTGDPLVDHRDELAVEKAPAVSESAILKLAKKQGMNTDVRRKIFDYVNAHEQLSQLKLTEIQQREIIRVLLHCCGIEKTYNPFYALVAQELCKDSHSHKVTLQFCLWDFLRELGEAEVGGTEVVKSARDRESVVDFDVTTAKNRVQNVAKVYAWLIAKGAANLMIFRPVNFTALQPRTVMFFQIFLVYMILDTQLRHPIVDADNKLQIPKKHNDEALEEVVMKAASNGGLAKGLIYFVSKLPPSTDQCSKSIAETTEWGLEVIRDTLKAGMDLAATLA
ncbi:ARM repeat-containing protein [Dacryopinax primogenitus]|uniref:ARM repeat-containing protein n=1 Tax=Dacryopinax primogenitus (strain DJM 731) TaxID=1858805 RepID=M5GDW2_DACPD|nr:ARM repeat-containing protein [Dacryopinax primogenitus]EJU04882.1 ARM repeat-containing protein [Dacryopinax primogenitus]